MKKIVLLGSSIAGVKALEEIRQSNKECDITMFALDGHYPFQRSLTPHIIAQDIKKEQILYKPKEFYQEQNINVVLDRKVTRVNLNRRKIHTEQKSQFDFDVLIIADTPENRFPDIKGKNKQGVYGFRKMSDLDKVINDLIIMNTITIQSDSLVGWEMAAAFLKKGKEVNLVCSSSNQFFSTLNQEFKDWIVKYSLEQKLNIIQDNFIQEVLGEGEVKAIKLKSGKVFAADMVFFSEIDEDLRLFADSSLEMTNKIVVDASLKTNVEGVYCVDSVSSAIKKADDFISIENLENQGMVLAKTILGEEQTFEPKDSTRSFNIDQCSVWITGQTDSYEGFSNVQIQEEGDVFYKRIFLQNKVPVGGVLVNADNEQKKLQHLIEQQFNIDGVEEIVLESSYDFDKIKQSVQEGEVPQSEPESTPELVENSASSENDTNQNTAIG